MYNTLHSTSPQILTHFHISSSSHIKAIQIRILVIAYRSSTSIAVLLPSPLPATSEVSLVLIPMERRLTLHFLVHLSHATSPLIPLISLVADFTHYDVTLVSLTNLFYNNLFDFCWFSISPWRVVQCVGSIWNTKPIPLFMPSHRATSHVAN